ncbi:MAG: dihydrolipoyl dehydrogenase [Neisseriaceae bacterium]|nr:MAG: dihydrolipoyl dehydrogenase [Neisseriaceae bacterium]
MRTVQVDVVIIGAGSAGMSAYRAARKHTDKIVIIEADQFGTTCARVGCMPSKLLISAANANHQAQNTDAFGIHVNGSVEVNGQEVMQRVKSERDRFVGFVIDTIKSYNPEHVIKGYAKFIDEKTVHINQEYRIEGKAFVIATGSRPRVNEEWKILGDKLQVNDDIFDWDDLPKSIAVMGTGVIGLEIGQALSRLGVRTQIFGRTENIGGISDPVVLEKAHQVFKSELNIHFNTTPKISLEGNKVRLNYAEKVDYVDLLLAASGRIPNTDYLGLESIGVQLDKKGVPITNPQTMQTSIPHIFIAGDASNYLPLLHVASDQGDTAGHNAGIYPKVEKGLVRSRLSVVFSEPQIVVIGQSYRDLDLDSTIIGMVEFENQGRSRVMLVNRGTLRVYFDRQTKVFLGAEMFGPAAEHIGHLLAWSHQSALNIDQMLAMPFYHPVIEEGLRTALRDAKAKFPLV